MANQSEKKRSKRPCAGIYKPMARSRVTNGWGSVIGMHTFGASAPLKALQQECGFTVDNVVKVVKAELSMRS
jgi:transketolase